MFLTISLHVYRPKSSYYDSYYFRYPPILAHIPNHIHIAIVPAEIKCTDSTSYQLWLVNIGWYSYSLTIQL